MTPLLLLADEERGCVAPLMCQLAMIVPRVHRNIILTRMEGKSGVVVVFFEPSRCANFATTQATFWAVGRGARATILSSLRN